MLFHRAKTSCRQTKRPPRNKASQWKPGPVYLGIGVHIFLCVAFTLRRNRGHQCLLIVQKSTAVRVLRLAPISVKKATTSFWATQAQVQPGELSVLGATHSRITTCCSPIACVVPATGRFPFRQWVDVDASCIRVGKLWTSLFVHHFYLEDPSRKIAPWSITVKFHCAAELNIALVTDT